MNGNRDRKVGKDSGTRQNKTGGARPERFGGVKPERNSGAKPERFGGVKPERNSGAKPERFGGVKQERNSGVKPERFGGVKPERNSGAKSGRAGEVRPKSGEEKRERPSGKKQDMTSGTWQNKPGRKGADKPLAQKSEWSRKDNGMSGDKENKREDIKKNGGAERRSGLGGRSFADRKNAAAVCPVFEKCGGCQLLHLSYEKQLEHKREKLEALLEGLCPVKGMIGMENPHHYRNKVHAVFDHDKKGNPLSGVYQEGTHILVPIEKCMIEDEKADEIIGSIRGMLRSFKIKTYDEDTGYGFLRHVLVKRGFATGEIMVVLVTASPIFPSKNNFIKALRKEHPEITTIIQNVNNRVTSMVLGDKEQVLYGKGFIEDELCGYKFRISPKSFYQVNPVQAKVLYEKALDMARLTGKETVLDAYCGVGTIGIVASSRAAQVIGVELNREAVKDAVQNAKQNDIKNIQFYCNDAGRFMTSMAERGEKVDVVLMDPPRSGSTPEFIEAVATMGPERVVYVSCGPESLARDLRVFKSKGYRAVECVGVDMFAGTRHVETICLLTAKIQ